MRNDPKTGIANHFTDAVQIVVSLLKRLSVQLVKSSSRPSHFADEKDPKTGIANHFTDAVLLVAATTKRLSVQPVRFSSRPHHFVDEK
jgi:hypothetical protein